MAKVAQDSSVIESIFYDYLHSAGSGIIDFAVNCVIAVLILVIGFRCIKHVANLCHRVFIRANVDPLLQTFLMSAIKIMLKILVIFLAINKIGVAASSVLAILSSGAIAFGLAIQGSLTNIAGGVVLLFMKPFKVGDWVIVGDADQEATVEEIGIMYTQIKSKDNKLILIPNGTLASSKITNLSAKPIRQEDILIGIEYSENIQKVREVLKKVVDNEPSLLKDHEIEIFVNAFKDSSIDIRVRFWVKNDDYWSCRWRTLENIKNAFDANCITIPFNQLDVNMKPQ